ncbi:MAG TPA: SAM-dependent methyltransferase [Planctomycetota bacterium]|nr:SAM-dependent methyltransferase [Planctomycetota bacterium]
MTMQLSRVVPWGRSRHEYESMFNLSSPDIRGKVLGCGDGPASFNAEMTVTGHSVISIDPIYEFSGAQIRRRFDESVEEVLSQVRATPDRWVWTYHRDVDELRGNRIRAIELFLADYDAGLAARRYRVGALPAVDFVDGEFELALCSHFLFLYSDLFDEAFHVQSVLELCRVASEVRIFPILNLKQERSPHLDAVQAAVRGLGRECHIERVRYELQKGGNEMLRIVQR